MYVKPTSRVKLTPDWQTVVSRRDPTPGSQARLCFRGRPACDVAADMTFDCHGASARATTLCRLKAWN